MKRFLRWLDVKHPDVAGPLDLRQRHVHEYRVWLENHGPEDAVNASGANVRTGSSCSPQTVWSYLLPIKALDVFRERLNSPLPFSPYDGNLTAKMLGAGEANEENATEPLPDEVIATLIDCARRYIEHYAPTVLAMREEMHEFWDDGRADFPGWKTSPGTCPETGITWMPDRRRQGQHGATEHVVAESFATWVRNVVSVIRRRRETALYQQAKQRSGSSKGQHGLTDEQLHDRQNQNRT